MTHHLVGPAEVAEILGVSRQRVHQLAESGALPQPEVEVAAGTIWRTVDIERWQADRHGPSDVEVPERDPERPQDDPWDADCVRYLLAQPGVADRWKRGPLMECLREQPGRLTTMPGRVEEAADLAQHHGVERRRDSPGSTIHLYRSDPGAPKYPADDQERRALLRRS